MNASVYAGTSKTLSIKGNFNSSLSNNRFNKKTRPQKNLNYGLTNNNFNMLYDVSLPIWCKNRLTENLVFAKVYNMIELNRVI